MKGSVNKQLKVAAKEAQKVANNVVGQDGESRQEDPPALEQLPDQPAHSDPAVRNDGTDRRQQPTKSGRKSRDNFGSYKGY